MTDLAFQIMVAMAKGEPRFTIRPASLTRAESFRMGMKVLDLLAAGKVPAIYGPNADTARPTA